MMDLFKYKRMYLMPLLLIVICSITIVCSSFNQTMILNGEGMLRIDADIRVVDFKMGGVTNSAFETYKSKYSRYETIAYVTLPQLTSTITYKVTVKNKTDKVYVISNITSSIDNTDITYTITDYKIGQGIGPKDDTVFYITFKYKDGLSKLPTNTKAVATIDYTFVIPYAAIVEYKNSQYTTCTDVQCALDELYKLLKV